MSLRFLHPLLLLVSTYSAYAEFVRNETAMPPIRLDDESSGNTIPLTGTINFSDDGGPAGDYRNSQMRDIIFDAGAGNLIAIRVNAFEFEGSISGRLYDSLGMEYVTDFINYNKLNDTVAPTLSNWLYYTDQPLPMSTVVLNSNSFGGDEGNGGGCLFGFRSTDISPDILGNTYPANAIGTWHTINARAVRFHFRSDSGITYDGWDIDIAQSLFVTDSDDDGLFDPVETNTGIYVDASDTGTDPNDNDTDDDGILDGVETNTGTFVDASDTGTNPNLADTSGDGFTDGFLVSEGFSPTTDYNALRTETVNQVLDLRPGSTMIEVSGNQATVQLQMEESSNLQSWEDAGDPATMTIPADTDTKFFRFKMAE